MSLTCQNRLFTESKYAHQAFLLTAGIYSHGSWLVWQLCIGII